MREEQSDRILDLVQSAAKVESEIETHTEEIGSRLDESFVPVLDGWGEGQTKPDFRATLRALQAKLGKSREALSLVEQHHIDLLRQAVEQRTERELLTGGLYEDFSSMRRTIEELYRGRGKDNVNAFVVAGIQGPTAQKPTKLLRQIDLAIGHMLQPDLEFPESRFGETRLEPATLVEVLKPRCKRLHKVQAELLRTAAETNASRKEKNRAIAAHKEVFLWVSRGAESLFHLAGEHELAERIRPSTRRPGRRAADVEQGKEGDSEGGATPSEGAQAGGSSEPSDEGGDTGESPTTAPPAADPAPESAPSPPSSDG